MEVVELPTQDSEARNALKKAAENPNKMAGVIVLVLNHDGSQQIYANPLSQEQRCLLYMFLGAYLTKWFRFVQPHGPQGG